MRKFLLRLFKTKYRIVPDDYCGFEAQKRPWFLPIYSQFSSGLGPVNTCPSVGFAERFIEFKIGSKIRCYKTVPGVGRYYVKKKK